MPEGADGEEFVPPGEKSTEAEAPAPTADEKKDSAEVGQKRKAEDTPAAEAEAVEGGEDSKKAKTD